MKYKPKIFLYFKAIETQKHCGGTSIQKWDINRFTQKRKNEYTIYWEWIESGGNIFALVMQYYQCIRYFDCVCFSTPNRNWMDWLW